MVDTQASHGQLLSFVTDNSGSMVFIHADLSGINYLIAELEAMRELLMANDCPHTHLFTGDIEADYELTGTKLSDQPNEDNIVHHVKIYGWNDEWASKHGLKKI